jgi:hypothetical protein
MSDVLKLPVPSSHVKAEELREHISQLQRNMVNNNVRLMQIEGELGELKAKHHHTSGFIYVASPYTHSDPDEMHRRYMGVMYYVMRLLQNRQWCYSPIVHCHEMARIHSLPTDAIFWMDYNFALLSAARELHVLCLKGWQESVGVKGEVAFWRHGKNSPVKFIEP